MGIQTPYLPNFNSVVNGLMVCYCDLWPAGQHKSHDTQMIKIKNLFIHNLSLSQFALVFQFDYHVLMLV
jgi:hypothetical protein